MEVTDTLLGWKHVGTWGVCLVCLLQWWAQEATICGCEHSNCCLIVFWKGKVGGIRRTDVPLKFGNSQVLGAFFCFILRDLTVTLTQPCCTAHLSLDLLFVVTEPSVWFQRGKNLGPLCSCNLTKKAARKELLQWWEKWGITVALCLVDLGELLGVITLNTCTSCSRGASVSGINIRV